MNAEYHKSVGGNEFVKSKTQSAVELRKHSEVEKIQKISKVYKTHFPFIAGLSGMG